MLSQRLKALRQEFNLTQKELADYLKLTPKMVSFYELGQRVPPHDILMKLSLKFQVSTDYLLGLDEKRKSEKGVKIPVLGRVIAGIPIDAITDIIDYEEIPEKMARTGDFFALEIKGTSMEPKLYEGDVVIVRKQESVDSGDIAIVLVNGDEATIKKVLIQKSGITLIAYNPSVYEPHYYSNEQITNLPIVILGKVVELRRKI